MISKIIKVSVRVVSLSLWLRLITLTSTLIILEIAKNLLIIAVTKLRCRGSCLVVLWFWPEWLTVILVVNNK